MIDARSDIFLWMSWVVKPLVPLGTRKPRTPVVGARPHDRDVGHRAVGDPHLLAVQDPVVAVAARAGAHAPGSEPASGSVRPKQPIASPAAMRGSHSCFCSSLPQRQIAYIASEPWTETRLRMPVSPASSSRQARP